MAFKRSSYLRATPVINGYADLYQPPLIPDFDQTEIFEITQKYIRRPDILAYELYGDAAFWWIFPLYNKNILVNPINDFTLGKRIIVPQKNVIAGI